jgi:4-amino-4-deoxy-L-arabinose transferase-like glycosyltransferase
MRRHGLLIFLGFFALYLVGAGGYDLFTDDELRYAEAGRQMLTTQEWVVPAYNGRPRFQKPVLFYWLQAAAQKLGGSNPAATRIPSALAGALVVWLTWRLGCRVAHPRVGGWAAVLLGLSVQMFLVSRMVLTDVVLLLFLQGTFTCFLEARLTREPLFQASWYRGMYFCMALGLLTKGPIALLLPGLVLVPWLARRGELRQTWRQCRPWSGLGILLLVAGPWYAAAGYFTQGEYWRHFLGHENWGRFTEVVNRHQQPSWFFLLLLLPLVFPWLGLLGPALRWGWSVPATGPLRRALPSLWLWQIVVVLALFTFSRTKVWTYILPLGPALALLMATWLDRFVQQGTSPGRWVKVAPPLFCLTTLGMALFLQGWGAKVLPVLAAGENLWAWLCGCAWLLAAVAVGVQVSTLRGSLPLTLRVLAAGVVVWYLTIVLLLLPQVDTGWKAPLRQAAACVRAYPEAKLFTVQVHELGLNFPTGLERVCHRRTGCTEELRLYLSSAQPVFVMVSEEHAFCLEGLPFHIWYRWPGIIFGANIPPSQQMSRPSSP